MFRLAHLSDIHLPLPSRISWLDMMSRRLIGYINWKRERERSLQSNSVCSIVADILSQNPDHVVVTGDLVNLALQSEFKAANDWLSKFGCVSHVSIVPGNHDAYVAGGFSLFCKMSGQWMQGDNEKPVQRSGFPYLRVRENIALIGVSSAKTSLPFIAAGYFDKAQAEKLVAILDESREKGLFRVMMIHHPPVRGAVGWSKRLFGLSRFQKIIREHGAELILHGHSHMASLSWIEGPGNMVPVLGVAAAGATYGKEKVTAQWNLLEVGIRRGQWNICLKRRGIKGFSSEHAEIERLSLSHLKEKKETG